METADRIGRGVGGAGLRRLTRIVVNVEHLQDAACQRWWDSALTAADTAPDDVQRLLGGADSVVVTHDDGRHVLTWCECVDGWHDAQEKPLLFLDAYDPATF